MESRIQIPEGTQDLLPPMAEEKRIMEQKILSLFKKWGYQEIITPTLEYYSTLSAGTGAGLQEKMYRLFDRQGKVLALRAEMTAPIARLVATKLDHITPAKVCYLANLFRYEDLQKGRYREFYQAGLECIGGQEAAVDAEILALAILALEGAGLPTFTLHIGHMLFFQGLCREYQLKDREALRFREALINRDFVTYREGVERSTLTQSQKENLLLIPSLQEKGRIPEQAYSLASNPLSQAAIENLESILGYLSWLGITEHCYVDLGIFRDLDYYSGMVFEGFAPGLGFHICGGGRYDRLLEEFGPHLPACGFALGVDRLLYALKKGGVSSQVQGGDTLICFQKEKEEQAYRVFGALQKKGQPVELDLLQRPITESIHYAQKKGYHSLLYVGDAPPREMQLSPSIHEESGYFCYHLADWRE